MNIYLVAEKAGVSTATVSRVLNHSPKVKEETRQRVLRVIDELHFSPNAFARGLNSYSMRTIGLLCTDVSDYFFGSAISILEQRLTEYGYSALLCCTGKNKGKSTGSGSCRQTRNTAICRFSHLFTKQKS